MKKLISIILLIIIATSCNQETKQVQTKTIENKNSITDPNVFIGKHKAKAMILGVFHFNNPGLDDYKPKYPFDILSDKRQSELQILIESLAEYKPTKILVEIPRKGADSLINKRYQGFLNGTYDINDKKSETYQLAFRLAKILGHKKIYASDVKGAKWFGAEIDWENYDSDQYLKSLGQYEKSVRYDYEKMYEFQDSLKTVTTLKEYFKFVNNPNNRLKDHQAYLTQSILTGAGDLYIGADGVARWYQRNLKIFANTYDITDFSKEERILLLYGSGHVWQLRQLLTDSPDFEYVEVNEYLTK